MSMALALGPVTQLMTRSLYAVLNRKAVWFQKLVLTPEALVEVKFWVCEMTNFNSQHIIMAPAISSLVGILRCQFHWIWRVLGGAWQQDCQWAMV